MLRVVYDWSRAAAAGGAVAGGGWQPGLATLARYQHPSTRNNLQRTMHKRYSIITGNRQGYSVTY